MGCEEVFEELIHGPTYCRWWHLIYNTCAHSSEISWWSSKLIYCPNSMDQTCALSLLRLCV
jgi:hypothetical protein